VLPIAVELLEVYERSLVLFENSTNRQRQDAIIASTSAMQDHEKQMRKVARVLEILREAGYDCELAQGTLH
jgi:hypothetical protein